MTAPPATSASYGRISKDRPDIPKVANQLADLEGLAVRSGYVRPVEYAEEPGTSATKGKPRPGLDELIKHIQEGRYKVVLAVEQSRFNRSVMDNAKLMAACILSGTVLHTIREGQIDPANATDEFMSTIFAARDRHEARRIGERVRRANEHIIASKRPIVTKRPFGFERDGITPCPPEAVLVRWAIDQVLHDANLYKIQKHFEQTDVTPVISRKELALAEHEGRDPVVPHWNHAAIRGMLLRPGTYGLLVHRGRVVSREPAWKGIGTVQEYELVSAILNAPGRKRGRSREPKYLMSGLLRCSTCGGRMFHDSQRSHRRPDRIIHIYKCENRGDGRLHQQVMQPVTDAVVSHWFAVRYIYLEGNLHADAEFTVGTSRGAEVQTELVEVRRQKSILTGKLLAFPDFEAEFDQRARELGRREQALERQLEDLAVDDANLALAERAKQEFWNLVSGTRHLDLSELGEVTAETHDAVEAAFRGLPLEEQRALIRQMCTVTVRPFDKAHPRQPEFRISIEPTAAEDARRPVGMAA